MKDSARERKRLEELILLRIASNGSRGLRVREIKRAIDPYVQREYGASEWSKILEELLRSLEVKEITPAPHRLTASGKQRVLAFLELDALPANTSWSQIRRTHLPARLLGVSPAKARKDL